jgi:HSP20 family protein
MKDLEYRMLCTPKALAFRTLPPAIPFLDFEAQLLISRRPNPVQRLATSLMSAPLGLIIVRCKQEAAFLQNENDQGGAHLAGPLKRTVIDELKAMKQRMEELYCASFDAPQCDPQADREDLWQPATDTIETENELIFLSDLPGVTEANLRVECRPGRMVVQGRKDHSPLPGSPRELQVERPRGEFFRVFDLPPGLLEDGVKAELKSGVLRITIPRDPAAHGSKPQKIIVHEG